MSSLSPLSFLYVSDNIRSYYSVADHAFLEGDLRVLVERQQDVSSIVRGRRRLEATERLELARDLLPAPISGNSTCHVGLLAT